MCHISVIICFQLQDYVRSWPEPRIVIKIPSLDCKQAQTVGCQLFRKTKPGAKVFEHFLNLQVEDANDVVNSSLERSTLTLKSKKSWSGSLIGWKYCDFT